MWAKRIVLRQLLVDHAVSLNLLRLLLALLVLVSHSYPLGGFGPDPGWPTVRYSTTYGGFAVGAFFALSGLLVTMSGVRRTPYEFLRSRFLRIVPAYLLVVVVAAAVLAPVIWVLDHGTLAGYVNFQQAGPVAYVVRNLLFPIGLQYAINDVFATTTPYGLLTQTSAVNGSLWTLPFEIRCYVVALAVVIVGRGLGLTKVALAALGFMTAVLIVGHFDPEMAAVFTPAWMIAPMPELLFVFLCGTVLGTVAERLVVGPWVVGSAAVVYIATTLSGGLAFRTIGLGSLALLLPVLAALLPSARLQFFRNDLSYGAYVWAFPVQQTLAYAGIATRQLVFVALSLPITLLLAGLSWFLVERPALRLRHRAPREEPALSAVRVGSAGQPAG